MMRSLVRSLPAAALCLGLAACQRQADTAETAAEPVVLQNAMDDIIRPQAQVVVSVLIAALSDPPDPEIDPSKLTDTEWEVMETAAADLRDQFAAIGAGPIVVADPGADLFGADISPDAPTPADVQAVIEAHWDDFQDDAEVMRDLAEQWLAAIEARDAAEMWAVALEIDPACTECHEAFWAKEYSPHHDDEDHDEP